MSPAPTTQAEKTIFFLSQPPQSSTVTWFWLMERDNKYFFIREQHKFLLFVSFIARNWLTLGSKNVITEQNKNS
jgi:hypothetical protein